MKTVSTQSFPSFEDYRPGEATFRWWAGGAELALVSGHDGEFSIPIDATAVAAFRQAIDAFSGKKEHVRKGFSPAISVWKSPEGTDFAELRYANRGDPWDEGFEIVFARITPEDEDEILASSALSRDLIRKLKEALDGIERSLSANLSSKMSM
jgi:hypothetical protein